MPSDEKEITQLLSEWREGEDKALDDMIPLVYDKMRAIANYYLKGGGQTMSSTALVHEAYMRVFGQRHVDFQDRNHFFAVAAKIMRRLIMEYQTMRGRKKRGGGQMVIVPDNMDQIADRPDSEPHELEECLEKLEAYDKRKVWVIEMHYFVGLKVEEITEVLGVSRSTVLRELNFARAWLRRCLQGDEE
ncbi:MAG: ECF-type sigma factor [Acidobacteriota bacterium]|nr:ECF-type sigma factor [Acidobacteriota bacterium]